MSKVAKKNLSPKEASYAKAMLKYTSFNNQQILSYFIKPGYYIDQRVITELRRGKIHENIDAVSEDELIDFIKNKQRIFKDSIDVFYESLKIVDNKIDSSENKNVEFKLSFNERFDNLIKPILGFANAIGGFIMYGISDDKGLIGLNEKQIEKFKSFDLKKLNEILSTVSSSEIIFKTKLVSISSKKIGIIEILPSERKPVIAISNKDGVSAGKIYYRYIAETKEIGAIELEKIIEERTEFKIKNDMMKLISTILKNGIDNSIILNSKTGEFSLDNKNTFVLDEKLLKKINFVKEGKLIEKNGAPAISIIGEASPVKIETIPVIEDICKIHPHTLTYVVNYVRNELKSKLKINLQINNEVIKNILKTHKKYNIWGFHQVKPHGKLVNHYISDKAINLILDILFDKKDNILKYVDSMKKWKENNNDK